MGRFNRGRIVNSYKGLIVYELNSEETKAFAEVSKSCYPVFRKLTMDDRLFDAVLHFTGKK